MKKVLTGSVIALMVLFLSMGLGLAGQGQGSGQGAGDGTGPAPIHDITGGTFFTVTGTVVTIATGEGLELVTDAGTISVYGLGSLRYWDSLGVDRPAVGDTVMVSGYEVVYGVDENGENIVRNVATSITVGGVEVVLRDEEGLPLWRVQKGQNQE